MILTAGLTPAWQQTVLLDRLEIGEVNRAREVVWCASGKSLNVAVALAHLGAPSRAVALLGGPPGELIERELASLGVAGRWIKTHWATRVCTTILDAASGHATELVENAGPVTAAELDEWIRAYREEAAQADLVVISGSLPAGAPLATYRDLLAATPGRAILDFRGEELLLALEHRPWVVKPNREELAKTVGRPLESEAATLAAMRELNQRGAEWVIVTDGKGPVLASSAEGCFRLRPPVAAAVNPIGSGDSLAAGLAWGLSSGRSVLDALRLGMASAVENVTQVLPGRIDPDRARELAETIAVESVA